MLGKLLKYELKATSRVFVPLYIAILVVSIVNGLSLNLEILNIQGLETIVLMCLFISLFVIVPFISCNDSSVIFLLEKAIASSKILNASLIDPSAW